MSLYTAPSDYDYYDHGERPEPCQTRGCAGVCDNPSSCFCYSCRCRELLARADDNATHRHEQEADRRGFFDRRAADRLSVDRRKGAA